MIRPQMITDYHMGDFDFSHADISGINLVALMAKIAESDKD